MTRVLGWWLRGRLWLLLNRGATLGIMNDRSAGTYSQLHAGAYDRIYGARFTPTAAVEALAAAAADGAVLELGVGTGRLAIPLARRGIVVDGIDASPAMLARLCSARRRCRRRTRSRPGRLHLDAT